MTHELKLLSQDEIANSDPFSGHGLKVERPREVPDHIWAVDVLSTVLNKLSSGITGLAVFPQCAWITWDMPGTPPASLGMAMIRKLWETDIPAPAVEDVYTRLNRGETLSLAEVCDVLRALPTLR